ncbi:MAG: 23S rRNA (adenine(2503)-C(2))-methyltransferase RlmN [Oscillospiraceae bacterium]|nr:23S rRNA (adenine(2503)-C(2))-methyltransferase RlmN [Oscillospiraceae bacterium]
MNDIKSLLPFEIAEYFGTINEPAYRGEQVFRWLHRGVGSFSEMSNISEGLRSQLYDAFILSTPELLERQVSSNDGTCKYLWRLIDGNTVESVLMEYEHGLTACISTQVGCRMGCRFCASTRGGFVRNLTAGEMLDQLIFSQIDSGKRISNVVLMGIGEPLDNYDNVIQFIRLANHPMGINIGARHMTVSTVGIIENIDKLAKSDVKLSLAASLHAPDDETRSQLLPINKNIGVDELISACKRYQKSTGRRVSYEYTLIDGVNDSQSHGMLLAKKLKNSSSLVNLIPFNNVAGTSFKSSSTKKVNFFKQILEDNGITCTVRRRLGADIDAACGQLRAKQETI